MPRFTRMLADGMKSCGHTVEVWAPKPEFYKLPAPQTIKKWLGYIDQFLVFPAEVNRKIKNCSYDTLFVFTDHALGPWVPLVAERPHVIHCHDFLAQFSALGSIPQNPTSLTGRIYQNYIRRGYTKGRHFISVSENTRQDLHTLLNATPDTSEVVYNGLNSEFTLQDTEQARSILGKHIGLDLNSGYIVHVGGNEWYKNRAGVIHLYTAWRTISSFKIPLLLIGRDPSDTLVKVRLQSQFADDIYFVSNLDDAMVKVAYAGALVLLFPSLAEGFGWPIAEAMASGCPVITTAASPMTEVGGGAGFYIPCMPANRNDIEAWALEASQKIEQILLLPSEARDAVIWKGLANAERFDTSNAIHQIHEIYQRILLSNKSTQKQLTEV